MLSITLIFFLMILARMASNSGVFRYNSSAHRGNSIFYFYSEDLTQCLRACYEQPDCAVAQYDDGHIWEKGFCKLYKKGNDGTVGAYVLSREETDSKCMTEMATSDITFQKIAHQENVTKTSCSYARDVTVIQPYDREGRYSFFVTNTTVVANNWKATKITLFFSRKPGKNCTAVPIFHRADYRRLYFGEIYNVTGYYFYNAYAFADYCTTQDGECLGKDEIQEYVNDKGDYYSYDKPGGDSKNMKSSDLGQTFFIAKLKRQR